MSPQFSIAHYRITAKLGEGGMGEVYRATDTKLGRDVAIKILPEAFAQDADRMARFQREAQVLAALNHPNIAGIYGVEERALVMELVEGPTLAERIAQGPIPLEEALPIARQIAEALEYAHERGIIHRDLKPANIKITPEGRVKVLDFGLAKAMSTDAAPADPHSSPTLTMRATMAGVILGTAAYMSPEQARGQDADRRADIWAFGVVLYEMLTGRELFTGPTVSDTLAAVLKTELDLSAVPEPVRPIIERCLRKELRRRWQAIGDVRLALEENTAVATAPASVPVPQARRRLPWMLAAMLAGALLTLALFYFREAPPDLVLQLLIQPPEKTSFGASAISPDGRLLAFTVSGIDRALWVRRLDSSTPHALSGTEGASFPFWSPDSRYIGFFADGKLKRVDLSGGPVQTLASTPGPRGGTWNRDGTIVFAPALIGSLSVVSAAGGDAKALTHLDASRLEYNHRWPSFLPDGRHFLYVVQSSRPENSGIFLQSLDSTNRIRLLADVSNPAYAGGYLLFARGGTLMAQRFDVGRLRLTGEPFPITGRVGVSGLYAHAEYSVSMNGLLVYNPSGVGSGNRWTWFDRRGERLAEIGEPGSQLRGQLSPDEKQVLIDRLDPQLSTYDLWLIDLARGTSSRFTFDPGTEFYPVWSPDGARIAFASNRGGAFDIYAKSSSGAGKEELLAKSDLAKYPTDWSRDGRFLLYTQNSPKTLNDIWVLSLADQQAAPFLQTEYSERDGVFSADGKWVAYTSDALGKEEVYVKTFPASEGQWQISKGGGSRPRWNRNGKELFYLAMDGKIMAVEVKTGASVLAGVPQPLFETHVTSPFAKFAVTDDGQRFLVPSPVAEVSSAPMTVVVNWTKSIQP